MCTFITFYLKYNSRSFFFTLCFYLFSITFICWKEIYLHIAVKVIARKDVMCFKVSYYTVSRKLEVLVQKEIKQSNFMSFKKRWCHKMCWNCSNLPSKHTKITYSCTFFQNHQFWGLPSRDTLCVIIKDTV